uniref:Uncharacterized protein n=1 Tax=Arion vulgaris TaxID=1028688 RepID=A0A0B6YPJ2_9EUPU
MVKNVYIENEHNLFFAPNKGNRQGKKRKNFICPSNNAIQWMERQTVNNKRNKDHKQWVHNKMHSSCYSK